MLRPYWQFSLMVVAPSDGSTYRPAAVTSA
jgi:hypothetical protein